MASLVLTAIGSTLGASTALGATVSAAIGRTIGAPIDQALFGQNIHREGRRLEQLSVQTSSYGKPIPVIYGHARLAGNVIWARPIKEVATTTEQGGKGGSPSVSSTEYSYFASFAVAICEGEIAAVERIWADSTQLDLSQGTYRVYTGSEDQLPDTLIESFEGVGATPAYRGLAYVVVEDFPLADFGNRIPNFTFEVSRPVLPQEIDGKPLEETVKSLILIPGSGEFVYDSAVQNKLGGQEIGGGFVQSGYQQPVNYHNNTGAANGLLALDQMLQTCPNLEWVGLVVTWFGTDMDAGACEIVPKVEYKEGITTPDSWSVAGYDRSSAPLMTFDGEVPRYGGTPDDSALLRYIAAIKARGLKVMLFPMFFMDVANKPWRGRVTGSAADVAAFFTKTGGYNAFVNHYAALAAGKVDAFVIGSELIGLTSVHDGAAIGRQFPAVNALVSLAASVRSIMGAGTKLTYAADWSEYHHTEGGWYHLDPLWASAHIDFVGIDAYFPLTDEPQEGITLQKAVDGWSSGEHVDFIYTDEARSIQAPIADAYAIKNIDWWWKNIHINPDGAATAWVPESKKIWFTEVGFPSVDGATNQPNVFYDASSSESFFPRFSQGRIDTGAQRLGLVATELAWKDSAMVENRFIWTWDARPYPYWPDLKSVWADGDLWKTGHWVNGKLGASGLAAIIADLCLRAGFLEADFDVSRLSGTVEGFILDQQMSVRAAIESLMGVYFFDAVESDGRVVFVPRGGASVLSVAQDDLIPRDSGERRELVQLTRMQEAELPQAVSVLYLNRGAQYQTGHQMAQLSQVQSQEIATLNVPIVMGQGQAQQVAEISLYTAWIGRSQLQFTLPPRYLAVEPCDVITVQAGAASHILRVVETTLSENFALRIRGVLEDVSTYDAYTEEPAAIEITAPQARASTKLELLDIPALPGDSVGAAPLRFAMVGISASWQGAVLYRSADGGQNVSRLLTTQRPAVMGSVMIPPEAGVNFAYLDGLSVVEVVLLGGGLLASATEAAFLNGANAALLGDEILQFKTAQLIAEGQYRLTGLLRGRLGTEAAIGTHSAGERFILLDGRVASAESVEIIGLPRSYQAVTIGATLGQTAAQDFTHSGAALKPYAPVHVKGIRDSSGNLDISWIRRSRLETGWRDLVDAPLNEAAEAYEVEIMDGSAVVRTLAVSTASAIYSAAAQVLDFGSVQSSLTLRIAQLSTQIGRGHPAEETL